MEQLNPIHTIAAASLLSHTTMCISLYTTAMEC